MIDELKRRFIYIIAIAFVFQLHAGVVVCYKQNDNISYKPVFHSHCGHDSRSNGQTAAVLESEHNCTPCTDVPVNPAANPQKKSLRKVFFEAVNTVISAKLHRFEPAASLQRYNTVLFQSTYNISSVILLI